MAIWIKIWYAKKLKNESHILAILMNIQYVVEKVSIVSTVREVK